MSVDVNIFSWQRDLAEKIGDARLSALTRLQILERDDDVLAPNVGATTPDVLRAVLRVGSRETLLHAHLAFARLEARAGRFTACTRRLAQCYRTFRQQPNPQIEASCRLTEANLLSVQGEPESAREVATEAVRMARQCGWDKGLAIASGSLAVFCLSCGDTPSAEEMLWIAKGVGYKARISCMRC